MHGVHAPAGTALVLGVPPGVSVLRPKPGGRRHLHVPGQGRLLPLRRGRGRRGGLVRRPAVLVRAGAALRPLVLHGGALASPALPVVLPARRGLRQTLAEVLRRSQAPGLPLQGARRRQGRSGGDSGKNWGRLGQAGFMMASCRGGRTPETFRGPMADRLCVGRGGLGEDTCHPQCHPHPYQAFLL